jgi:UDP-2,3-diacylglucosamine pyrophosphatase LpxH
MEYALLYRSLADFGFPAQFPVEIAGPVSQSCKTNLMLIIVSDLHLTDGTVVRTTSASAFALFARKIKNLVYEASFRTDGSYSPVRELHLLLLGDVFDVTRSVRWSLPGDRAAVVKPWDDPADHAFLDTVSRVTDGIVANNAETGCLLRALQEGTLLEVPVSPSEKQTLPVKVSNHYMVGNHDWFYHLSLPGYERLRQKLARDFGLANDPDAPFAHDPEESPPLKRVLEGHRVQARHGDIFDGLNFERDRDASSIGDVVVVELLNRFPLEVENQLGRKLPGGFLEGLKEIDSVRPWLLAPTWVEDLLFRNDVRPELSEEVKRIWDRVVEDFLGLAFIRARDTSHPFDIVDRLELLLKFSRGLSIRTSSRLLAANRARFLRSRPSFRDALREAACKSGSALYVVYGHSHIHEMVSLPPCRPGSAPAVYFNSGTWRRVYESSYSLFRRGGFTGYDALTFLVFFQGSERRGRPYERWSGSLGIA